MRLDGAAFDPPDVGFVGRDGEPLSRGRYCARYASTAGDFDQSLALRALGFGAAGGSRDGFDPLCRHILVYDTACGALVCCFRVLMLDEGRQITRSYSAQSYDLSPLAGFAAPMAEIGRFCIHPDRQDPDILRIAWAFLTGLVDAGGVGMLFGCSSFAGTDPAPYLDAFALLRARHLAPSALRPRIRAGEPFRYATLDRKPDARQAMAQMPPLLRSYLLMGGWVSDHAVVDRQMNTLHVFTALDIAAIPPARKRLLRAIAAAPH